ncbi:hypothetical protein Tco_1393679 [Tanacetum coccineum]
MVLRIVSKILTLLVIKKSNDSKENSDDSLVKEVLKDTSSFVESSRSLQIPSKRMVYGNNYNKVNYNYTTKRTHPNAQRNMVPRAVLMKTGLKTFTARTVNTAHPKSTVFSAKPMASHNRMTQDLGGAHGGRISSKGTLKIDSLDFEDVYFVNEHVKRGWDTKIPQSSGPPVKVGDEAVYKELDDIMERAATTVSSLEAEQDSGSGPRCQDTILGGVDAQTRHYLVLPVQVPAAEAKANTVNGERQLQALVDKKRVIITESSIRSDLHLADAGGIDCLPTATIFEELARMGAKSIAWNEFSSTMASTIICLATNQKFNLSKYVFDDMQAMDEIVTDVVDWAMQAPLRARFRDLSTIDMKEIIQQRMFEDNSYKAHDIYSDLYEALQKSLELDYSNQRLADQEEARKKKRKKRTSGSSQLPPPPPPSSTGASRSAQQAGSEAPAVYAWGSRISIPWIGPTYDTRFESTDFMTAQELSPKDSLMQDDSIPDEPEPPILLKLLLHHLRPHPLIREPSITTIPDDLYMDDETTADEQAYSSGEEVGRDHIPTVNLRQSWWKPLTEDRPATPEPAWTIPSSDLPVPTNNWASALKTTYVPPPENSLLAQTGDIATFMDWYCKRQGISELTPKDLEGPAYEIVKVFHPDVVHLQFQMEECHKLITDKVDDAILNYNVSKPLPLGGEPGHITIQADFFFNKDLEYLRYGRKIGRPALSISKMKAAFYPDVGLEQLVPDQFWIEEECKYDIAAMYGISHWWFQRQRFYIDRFSSEGDRRAVRTHMRILSVVQIEVFSMYGYNYMKKIILRRADLKEYVIAERDFKYMYPSNFEDLYLLNLQGYLNHLSPDDKKVLTTTINLWTRNLVIRQCVEDFQLRIENSPRAVTFRDRYRVQMIIRFNEIHKFSNGTQQQIDEALDYRVKEFRVNRINPGMNTRFWTKKDVVRSKEFMSYKDGKVRYSLPRSCQNWRDLPRDNPLVSVEVLRSVLTDPKDQVMVEMEIPRSSGVNSQPHAHT